MMQLIAAVLQKLIFPALHLDTPNAFPPPLSAKEEKELLKKKEAGDTEAEKKLIEHNLRLVSHIIKKYYARSEQTEDLISIGTIGLIKGIRTFNAAKGTKLATYAARCVENEILMYFRASKKTQRDVSLSEPIDTDSEGEALTLTDVICVEDNTENELDTRMKCDRLRKLIDAMEDDREKQILILRYGLYDTPPLAQREVAGQLGISRSYVSRIEKKILLRLKKQLEEENLMIEPTFPAHPIRK